MNQSRSPGSDRPFKFRCSGCEAEITTTYAAVGQEAACSSCGQVSKVPLPRVGLGLKRSAPSDVRSSEAAMTAPDPFPPERNHEAVASFRDPPADSVSLGPRHGPSAGLGDENAGGQDGAQRGGGHSGHSSSRPDSGRVTLGRAVPSGTIKESNKVRGNETKIGSELRSETSGRIRYPMLILTAVSIFGFLFGGVIYTLTGEPGRNVEVIGDDSAEVLTDPDPSATDPVASQPTPSAPEDDVTPQPSPSPINMEVAERVSAQWTLLVRRFEAAGSTVEEIRRLSREAQNPLFAEDTEFVGSILTRVDQLKSQIEDDRRASEDGISLLQGIRNEYPDIFIASTQNLRDTYAAQGRQNPIQYIDLLDTATAQIDSTVFQHIWESRFSID